MKKFIEIKSKEMNINENIDQYSQEITDITGGLPLAIQWTLGRYKLNGNISEVLNVAVEQDSPLLEFSFGNLWRDMDTYSQNALGVLSIFDEPPTANIWRTSLDWPVDRFERSVETLQSMTLVREETDVKTGSITYRALPITLTFSRNRLKSMGNLEMECRTRYQRHVQSMQLVAQETDRYNHLFEIYEANSENHKKALVLCRIAESQEDLGPDASEEYYLKAYALEPRSVYVLVKYGSFLIKLGRAGEGLDYLNEATKRSTKRTGFFAYYNLAIAYDILRNRQECAKALQKALEFEPFHSSARHMLGVTLSRLGQREEALLIFDNLIDEELKRPGGPTNTLVYALRTKVITLDKLGRKAEASDYLTWAIQEASKYPRTHQLLSNLEEML